MWPRKRMWRVLALWVCALFALAGCAQSDDAQPTSGKGGDAGGPNLSLGVDAKQVVARYDGGEVTAGEFEKYLALQYVLNPLYRAVLTDPESREEVLRSYIAETILADRAGSADVREEADNLFDAWRQAFDKAEGSRKAADQLLKRLNLTEDDVRNYLVRYKRIETYLAAQVKEEDLKKRYAERQRDFTVATVRHILISTDGRSEAEAYKLATELARRIQRGEDMAALAKQYSDDPGSKEKGGVYENARVTEWVPEFQQAVLTQAIGKVGAPVKTAYGYHVIRVEKREVLPFEQVREELRVEALNEAYNRFYDKELPKHIRQIALPKPT
ncbi:peptidylprolyl isomerase [Calditerricola satsumensis]|uniref:peptidylprolyl isomerase n=1 Tax=Calditerricola satsumensis TaxID=373054 RepID=UPI0009F82B1E|nr:peptidylprolyl isomerase [Calditerricola satsumensis]